MNCIRDISLSHEPLNPYQPPQSAPAEPAAEQLVVSTIWARATLLTVLIACTAYLYFVYLLINSSQMDRQAGFLFCLNIPVFLVWIFGLVAKDRRSHWGGITSALVQAIICCLMIISLPFNWLIVIINGAIAFGFLVLAAMCYWGFAGNSNEMPGGEPS